MNGEVVTVSLGDRSYDIFFATGVYSLFREWVNRFFRGAPVFVVTDQNVYSIYGDDIRKWLQGVPHEVLSLTPGEAQKHGDTVKRIYSFLAGNGAGRDSLVLAFGGGVVGDLAGFAAATFLRGLPYIQVPTTLVSQVDSSVGGKTGYNLPEGKNLVGAFHQPRAVFIDPGFLLTLSDRDLLAGMAEVVKCAYAGSPALLETISARSGSWRGMTGEDWLPVIRSAVAFKAKIVETDEREASARRMLNLGHTIGHALEQATGYGRLLHGEAVAMGLAWEAVFSRRQGITPAETADGLIDLLRALGFPLRDPGIPLQAIADAIGMDKKRVVMDIDMPILTGPGSCVLMRIPVSLLREELPAVRKELDGVLREKGEVSVRGEPVSGPEAEIPGSPDIPADALDSIPALERMVVENPRNREAMIALAEAYRRGGNLAGAWETIKEVLHQQPSSARAQHVARDIEREMKESPPDGSEEESPLLEDVVILDEGAFELRPADRGDSSCAEEPASPPGGAAIFDPLSESFPRGEGRHVRTVTLANIYWDQGKHAEARRIIEEILSSDPSDPRALAWLTAHPERSGEERGKRVVAALRNFLEKMTKEFGHDIPRHH